MQGSLPIPISYSYRDGVVVQVTRCTNTQHKHRRYGNAYHYHFVDGVGRVNQAQVHTAHTYEDLYLILPDHHLLKESN